MECYICFETYTNKSGIPCKQCANTCCGNCFMKQFIMKIENPKCAICRYEDYDLNMCPFKCAINCGFDYNEANEFKKEFIQKLIKRIELFPN
jgi:hypothetical protein